MKRRITLQFQKLLIKVLISGLFSIALFRTVSVQGQQVNTVWQLAYWESYASACTIVTSEDRIPTNEEIRQICGEPLYQEWLSTPLCEHSYAKTADALTCTGLFLRRIGQQAVTVPTETPIQTGLMHIRFEIKSENCLPSEMCSEKPEITLKGISLDGTASYQKVHIRIQSYEGECAGADCRIRLPETNEQGEWLEYWAMTAAGDQGEHYWLKFRVVNKSADGTDAYRYDVISESLPKDTPYAGTTWSMFPSSTTQIPAVLERPYSVEYLTTKNKLSLLSAKLIQNGNVDASSCIHYGLSEDGSANGCGEELTAEMVFQWQNKYDEALFEAGNRYQMPPRLIKGLIAQESQFWPISTTANEYGLGKMTENGVDVLLRWNNAYYLSLCQKTFKSAVDICGGGFSNLSKDQQISLRGEALKAIGTSEEIDLITATIKASTAQVNQLVQNATGLAPSVVTTYEDMWKFTIANYYSGSGCLYNALSLCNSYKYAITWENAKTFMTGICSNARDYVDRVYELGE